MKNLIKAYFVFSILAVSMAACTAGDKGSGHVPDSSSMDTSQAGSSAAGNGGKSESFDSSAMGNKATPGTIPRDTTQKDRSANGGADFKPKKMDTKGQ